ncbi:hypothetical protein F2Q69_00021794 [Brassica cretica]|uniref:Uncharacterized protein n=1 Tax=Brassica cretica TaxID=69181 RepID=A0A8S9QE07_BRACR|nr:hypothetical protein F2Q69_00021794 [Brassica cretica]
MSTPVLLRRSVVLTAIGSGSLRSGLGDLTSGCFRLHPSVIGWSFMSVDRANFCAGAVNGSVGFRRLTQPALMWMSTSSIENGVAGFKRVFDGVAFFGCLRYVPCSPTLKVLFLKTVDPVFFDILDLVDYEAVMLWPMILIPGLRSVFGQPLVLLVTIRCEVLML